MTCTGTSTTSGYGSGTHGTSHATHGTHTGTGMTGAAETGATGTGTGTTSGYGSTNAGPHSSNVANKADPRVDSDLGKFKTIIPELHY